ncbi:hypothetical protein ASE01_07385 [Nocardioides sp. Root190]|uniref:hypothetical protein n=1 Tax=Nocardioides sp. Root190 TaxID=1736488 RepID=UPI0006FFD229|nr:hypothetical protein [Nocardioides sp. Root190]KRB77990.1 hypothetical protein ASE01_07385 [Nocardioides sp. Root190]
MPTDTVPNLARQAEQILVAIARESVDPITYGELAERLTPEGQRAVPARQIGKVIVEMRDRRGTWSWTPFLTAWVVNADTGEPGEGYFVNGVGDAAAVRAKTHERLVGGIYEA